MSQEENTNEPSDASAGPDAARESGSVTRNGLPLGPGSLTWRYLGDVRNVLVATRAGVLQTMHPAISAGLVDHSDFFVNPWNRLLRSAGPILGVVYDARPTSTAGKVRDYHGSIKGQDASGRRYHALDPKTYYWAHATFFEGQIAAQELFGEPLTRAQKEQLYRESITWYARYGMTMAPVPPDYAAFEAYWDDVLENVLEETKVARVSVQKPKRKMPAPYKIMRGPIWWVLRPIVVDGSLFLTRATLPAKARAKLGLTFDADDEKALARFASVVRFAFRFVPERLRYMPRAYRGMETARRAPPSATEPASASV